MKRKDTILQLLDWNNPISEQRKGIDLARSEKDLQPFLQPCHENYNKNVWGNCSVIISERSDEELSAYLIQLFDWLQDLTWPGAEQIFERLISYQDDSSFNDVIAHCIIQAENEGDEIWAENLEMLQEKRKRA